MKITTLLIVSTVTWFVGSIIYWIYRAHKAAKRNGQLCNPRPPSPAPRDAQYLEQQRRDSEIEAEWRRNVIENELRRKENKPLSSMLIRQAD